MNDNFNIYETEIIYRLL